jgi:hypothetical protein
VPLDTDPVTYKEQVTLNVYIGETKYLPGTGAGTYSVLARKIKIHLEAGLAAGNYPLRIFANGVESPPNWIIIQ